MQCSGRRRLKRGVDIALPVVVALFLASLVEDAVGLSTPLTLLGIAAGVAQGAALWWRRSHPEIVMAIAIAGGLVVQLVAPQAVFPYAGLIAIFALAGTRPPLLSLPALAALLGITALNYLTGPAEDATFAMAFPDRGVGAR